VQGSAEVEQGFLQRGVLVIFDLSSAVLAQVRHAPVVGPMVADVEDALRPYSSRVGEHLKQHGRPLLAFGDQQVCEVL
jgi:hypothetical protein